MSAIASRIGSGLSEETALAERGVFVFGGCGGSAKDKEDVRKLDLRTFNAREGETLLRD